MPDKKRNPSLDVLRIFAFFLVVSLHFLHCSEFDAMIVGGKKMLVMYIIRTVTVGCVPIFIMLTGYLMTNKTLSKKFYGGLIRPAVTYLLAAAVCLGYKVIKYDYSTKPWDLIQRVLDFTASDYGWYMEMYFGLFLMIPFLNLAYHGLKGKGQKLALIGTCLVLTALPGILNTFNLTDMDWWKMPVAGKTYDPLIPDWWSGFYPVTYYFLGSYLREYPLRLKKWQSLALIATAATLVGWYDYYRFLGGKFHYGAFITNASLFVAIPAVLVFSFFAERDMRNLPTPVTRILGVVSGWTLAAYLVSQIFDVEFYRVLKERVSVVEDRMYYAPVMVLVVFTASLILGGIIDGVFRLGQWCVRKITRK